MKIIIVIILIAIAFLAGRASVDKKANPKNKVYRIDTIIYNDKIYPIPLDSSEAKRVDSAWITF